MNSFTKANRIVVKVGTSTLTHETGQINIRRMERFIKVLADIKNSGKELIIVTSGAIGIGFGKMGVTVRPTDTPSKQAAASIGQCELMYLYDKLFTEYNHVVSQILLTRDVVEDEKRKEHVINTFKKLLEYNIIPIVNENDTVSVEELVFGDNDTLSAIVATLTDADVLVLLSDVDGLFTANPKTDPNAKLIHTVTAIDEDIMALADGAGSARGTGGMVTKLHAARIATEHGIDMAILNGCNPELLYDLFDGESVGTVFSSCLENGE